MQCQKCSLNIESASFKPSMARKLPVSLRDVFVCNTRQSQAKNHSVRPALCVKDLWVLTFIGQNDEFARANVEQTVRTLVEGGHGELLCNLFENASYQIRKELWLMVTTDYPDRLYLFDRLFEKHSLAPFKDSIFSRNFHLYQYQMLFAGNAAHSMPADI